ncbi:hypothetical protein OPV22_025447 [Ensete ventricosum]|uniref:NAD-dependent epimerase/dehydratase domain-containing protein n=1 Tax=Ensete ventricosum TaxID=4639 RepID=A0AAV8Q3T6_ENSVE|nr:hypothetical protein OPV22_025447 [Ensete ventricosum]
MSMPHLSRSSHPPPPQARKKPSKLFRSLHRLLRSVLLVPSMLKVQVRSHEHKDRTPHQKPGRLASIPETSEKEAAAFPEIRASCEVSGTVRRVIYTGSVSAASPLKEDDTGFKDSIDESCWTPLHLSYDRFHDFLKAYLWSKTLSEKELLMANEKAERGLEVVSLTCALVGGDAIVPHTPLSVEAMVSPVTGKKLHHVGMRFLQAILGSVPLVHIDDVCEALVFCMERESMAGRFLCAVAYPTMQDIVDHYAEKYPQLPILIREVEGEGTRIPCSSTKLEEMGFKYKYSVEQILEGSVECAKRLGAIEA